MLFYDVICLREDLNVFVCPIENPTFWVWMSGKSYCDGTYTMDRPCAETCVVEYIIKGSGTLELDGKKYNPKAGDIYILPLGSHQKYQSWLQWPQGQVHSKTTDRSAVRFDFCP